MALIVVPLQTVMLRPGTHVGLMANPVTAKTIKHIFVLPEFVFSASKASNKHLALNCYSFTL
jgi:hypothetical protein